MIFIFLGYKSSGLVDKCEVYSDGTDVLREKGDYLRAVSMRSITCQQGQKLYVSFSADNLLTTMQMCDKDINSANTCKTIIYDEGKNEN